MITPSRLVVSTESRLFVIRHLCSRLMRKLTGQKRPSSTPYLSGDSFRSLADHVFDEVGEGAPVPAIGQGEVVFVAGSEMEKFFKFIHPKITTPYVLLTHNSDANITAKDASYIDQKIIRWFAQNVTIKHPKITPIPIGLENLHFYQNGVTTFFTNIRRQLPEKAAKIFYHFKVRTNPRERQTALDSIKDHPLTETLENKLPPRLYLRSLSSCMFVVSPPGNGVDCHRTWEALYLGVVPIVKRSAGMEYFKTLGLPILIIDDWRELETWDENKLRQIYTQMTKEADWRPLFMDYWEKEIRKTCASN